MKFMIVYPAFLVARPEAGPPQLFLIGNEENQYIPLFTDDDSMRTFMERKGVGKYHALKVADPEQLGNILKDVPDKSIKVALDPLATDEKTSPALVVLEDLLQQL